MASKPRVTFEKFFSQCERHRWELDTDVEWDALRRDLVTSDELDTLRLAALTEGFTPTYIADLLEVYLDDIEMCAFFSIQYYEEYKHFHALRRYLGLNSREITDEEVMARRGIRTHYESKLIPLMKFGLSEIFTAIFYRNLSDATAEPVMKQLCRFIAADEYRHLGYYMSALEHYVHEQHMTADDLTQALKRYQHQGLEAVEDWMGFWQNNGKRYTGLEPYVVMQNTLSRIVGTPVSLRDIMRRTAESDLAQTFR